MPSGTAQPKGVAEYLVNDPIGVCFGKARVASIAGSVAEL
jgi:hypothetical protein